MNHRSRPSTNNRQQLATLVGFQITHLHTLSHRPSLRDPDHQVVDASPPTFQVTARLYQSSLTSDQVSRGGRVTIDSAAWSWKVRFD